MAGDAFLIDADALIQAARQHYAFDLVPAFWDRLVRLAESGTVRSIDRVKEDLLKGKDDLAEWAKAKFADAFASTNEADVIEQYRGACCINPMHRCATGAHRRFERLATANSGLCNTLRDVMKWVQNQDRFLGAARAEFADGADGWLVAYAAVKGLVVVTHEQPAPESRTKVKIPDVCQAFGVRHVNTFGMLRELKVRLS